MIKNVINNDETTYVVKYKIYKIRLTKYAEILYLKFIFLALNYRKTT